MVELLLNHGVDPNKRDIPCKIKILDYAFFDGRMTQRMILAGADLSEPRDIQNNVFRMDIETVRMALEKMRSVPLPDPARIPSLIMSAATRGNRGILSLILSQPECSSMLDKVRTCEGSALHMVIKNGKIELAWTLIAAGIDINLTSSDGIIALHLA